MRHPSRLLWPLVQRSNYGSVKPGQWPFILAASSEFGTYRIRAVSPEPSLLAHTSSESRGVFRQKARSLAPLNGWACAVKICHDGMLEDTNSLDGAHFIFLFNLHCMRSVTLFYC